MTAALTLALLPACAPGSPAARAPRSTVVDTEPPPASVVPAKAAAVTVALPKAVAAELDCERFLPALAQATGIDVEVREHESTAELCRYALPYNRGITTASVFFRAEPPGTPSYRRTEDLFGNTTYEVDGSAGKDCGISVAIDAGRQAHEHGSHLTVLGTYEAVEEPCVVTRRIAENIFAELPDA
ncbi:hypothetical protein GCM10010171_00620 [Actinokineospora fastidiosa]|uniref:DUF3558 domain-containing protein n=1 Tax=Actinokineospora fastidiosa TaxID=1816 RepID=A0A918G240_9PSEU|nr:hypothetical protein Actkin_00899 [Actinokineospora sp. UTMC 2448]GGS12819.1 hypothetical protein GCM10010171_00620 [Actinokineospora fastidiosa]